MLKQILSYIMITEQVTGEVRLSLCLVVSISERPRSHSEGECHPCRFTISIVVTGIIKLVPGSPNYGLRSSHARGFVSHITPFPSVAGPLSLANSTPQNLSLASVTCSQGEYFPLPIAASPEDGVPMQITCPETFIPLHCSGVIVSVGLTPA